MQKVDKLISDKLFRLSSFLHHAYKEFDDVSKQIKDRNIKMSLRSVALETKQYAGELNSQLKTLMIKNTLNSINEHDEIKSGHNRGKNITDKKIIELCCNTEVYFLKAYRSILKEYFPYTGLRDTLRYQVNGIK